MENLRNWVIGFTISVLALVLAFWGVQPGRFLEAMTSARYFYLLPVVGLSFVGLLSRARSWHLLLQERIRLRRAFMVLNEGYLLNNILPLRLGELGRAYLLTRNQPIRTGRALASVIVERMIDVLVSLFGLILAFPFVVSPVWAYRVAGGAAVGLLAIVCIVFILASSRTRLQSFIQRLPGKAKLALSQMMEDFLDGLAVLGQPFQMVRAAFWSSAAWLTSWLQLWLLLDMFEIRVPFAVPLFVSGVVAFGAAIPSLPGAIGVYELSTVAGLMVFHISQAEAISVAVLAHGVYLFLTSGLGAWALSREGETVIGIAMHAQQFIRHLSSKGAT